MGQYFAYSYTGAPFEQFGAAHISALVVILGIAAFFWRYPDKIRGHQKFRFLFAAVLVINELSWHAWHAYYGLWSVQEMLPLDLCNLLVFISAFALVTKKQLAYEFTYLLGIPAASQVLVTPALGPYGFPHVLFFQIFISHGGIVLAALYLTLVEGMGPTSWRSVGRVAAWTTLYAFVIFFLNQVLNSNYLFLAYKPPAATLIDFLGPWPWYILSMEAIGLILVVALYIPFAIRSRAIRGPGTPENR